MTALWLCVVVLALAAARACRMVGAAIHQGHLDNPTENEVDAALAHMEDDNE